MAASGQRKMLSVSFLDAGSRETMEVHCFASGLTSIRFSVKLTVMSAAFGFAGLLLYFSMCCEYA